MAKQIIYDSQAKEKILAGVNKLEKAVTMTLGPCGKNVIIDEFGSIHTTKDGVTVAKSITLKDPFENLGANAVKEVAEKSNSNVGDGTTTSTLLAASIYKNGLKHVTFGSNATQIKNGIQDAAEIITEIIEKHSKKIESRKDLERVATVSANGDTKIGTMIADVMDKIGNDGTIKVENGNGTEMTSSIIEGMVIDQTYVSPYMITNSETMEVDLENPFILIANKKLSNFQELLPCLQSVSQTGRPLFIIAEDFSEDVLGTLIMNRMRGGLNSAAIKSPSYGDNRKAILEDIAVLCDASVVADETGVKLEHATIETGILGQANRIVVNKENTVIIGGIGSSENVEKRANGIRKQIEACTEEYDREKLQERLAKLTSGIGIISVGATTEAERKELRDRVDDAFSAAKAALRKGIVAGGGVALLKAKKDIQNMIPAVNSEYSIGYQILIDSLDKPMKKILENAGIEAGSIIERSYESDNRNFGYDVTTKAMVDMIEAGIIDPTEVVINEIRNAASIAGLLLTTDCLICEDIESNKHGSSNCTSCASHGIM
jgi:chaperonin GroEL